MIINPIPISRTEKLLYKLGGGNVNTIPEPISRVEQYLNYLVRNGVNAEIPAVPLTRIEWFLDYLCKNWSTIITSGCTITYMNDDGSETINIEHIVDGGNGTFIPTDTYVDTTDGQIIGFAGWAATAGGTINNSLVQNVTTDITVYAVYAGTGEYVPDHIAVTTPPTKTEYEEGETLDFTGIEVTIYKKDDSVWTDTTHPQGKALFSELEFPVTVATLPEEGD
jgi:hypothetical protein